MRLLAGLIGSALAGEICYNKDEKNQLGCYTDDPPFSVPLYRPKRLPVHPDSQFHSIKLDNQQVQDEDVAWNDPISRTHFDLEANVVVLTHGWIDNTEGTVQSWFQDSKDAFREHTNVNLVSVDWRYGSQILDYFQAASNTQTVGRAIGNIFQKLKKKAGFKPAQFHCVGHSLGAHACAYAGKWTQSQYNFKIGRITGLDPAGPSFEQTKVEVRLDKSDAEFVDIIHCNGGDEEEGFLGYKAAFGHSDFYPNGGSHQPMCKNENNFICDHNQCPNFFLDSIVQGEQNGCTFNKCESTADFEAGLCDGNCPNGCSKMGYYAEKPEKNPNEEHAIFYGETGKRRPFCGKL